MRYENHIALTVFCRIVAFSRWHIVYSRHAEINHHRNQPPHEPNHLSIRSSKDLQTYVLQFEMKVSLKLPTIVIVNSKCFLFLFSKMNIRTNKMIWSVRIDSCRGLICKIKIFFKPVHSIYTYIYMTCVFVGG